MLVALCTGCAAPQIPFSHPYEESGTRVCFPSPPTERRAHEGPFARALIVHTQHEGMRYELARFDLPRPLSPDKRRDLMALVHRGLRSRPDAHHIEAGTIVSNGTVTSVLSMRLAKQRVAIWHLSFPTPQQMLQVSIVGPRALREPSRRFLASVGSLQCER